MKILAILFSLFAMICLFGSIANLLRFTSDLFIRGRFNNKSILHFMFFAFLATSLVLILMNNPQTFDIKVVPNNQTLQLQKTSKLKVINNASRLLIVTS
ncbi:MAG: hypothetical protein ACJAS1_005688 [Oleiphilaceae bacterium]|jgi:hypothetical protein